MVLPAHSEPWLLTKFLIHLSQSVGLLGRLISLTQEIYLNIGQHKQNKRIHTPNIHALSGIRTHDPSVRASEDSSCLFFIIVSGVRLSPLGTAATTGVLYQPQMIDDGDCGEIGGMKIGGGNRSTRRKPAPAPLCPPQMPHDETRARTRAAAVGSQGLTAWAMARP
jgi:hypothetical protein